MKSIGSDLHRHSAIRDQNRNFVDIEFSRSKREFEAMISVASRRLSTTQLLMPSVDPKRIMIDGIDKGCEITRRVGIWNARFSLQKEGEPLDFTLDLFLVNRQSVMALATPRHHEFISVRDIVLLGGSPAYEAFMAPGGQCIEIGAFSEPIVRVPPMSSLGYEQSNRAGFADEIQEEVMNIMQKWEATL